MILETVKGGTRLTRTSSFTGKLNTMIIPVNPTEVQSWLMNPSAQLIQRAFPNLTADEREFIMTGSTPAEWDTAFPHES